MNNFHIYNLNDETGVIKVWTGEDWVVVGDTQVMLGTGLSYGIAPCDAKSLDELAFPVAKDKLFMHSGGVKLGFDPEAGDWVPVGALKQESSVPEFYIDTYGSGYKRIRGTKE